ncbi:MAG: peptide ABC transporter substrate-binding protein [Lactobacillus sp.]|jgi:oligopeptide transport system substrate-binding protein|nr:peptide ABC transporter substrate-binding protein [Lactobacillus sp.]
MKIKHLLAAGMVSLTAVALAACSNGGSSSNSKTINWMDSAEIPSMDISKATDVTSFNQMNNVMEGLYRLGKDSKAEPALAKKTTVSSDGKTYTFTLRPSKWSNGKALTAKDFVYSWQRTVNPKTNSQYSYLFSGIKNADDITAGKKPVSSLGIKAVGKYKLVVKLDKRIPYFKLLMAFPLFFPQNKAEVQKDGSKYGTASKYMAYNGPFTQVGWTGSNLSWKLKKNPNYWDKKAVKLDTINYSVQKTPSTGYNLYQSNKLDATILDANQTKQLKGKSGYTLRDTASTFYLQYNQKSNKYLKNANLRKAIALSINRKQLGKAVGGDNRPASALTAYDLTKVNGKDYTSGVKNDYAKYDPKEAKTYFKKAQQELGTKNIELSILSDDTDAGQKTTEFLQSQLESNLKGLKISVQNVPFKTRLSRSTKGNFDIVVSGWSADFADPISFLDLFTANNSNNNGHWKNNQYDTLVAESKSEGNNSKRIAEMQKAENIILADQGITPLYNKTEAWMVNTKVKGLIYNGAGANYNFKTAYVK